MCLTFPFQAVNKILPFIKISSNQPSQNGIPRVSLFKILPFIKISSNQPSQNGIPRVFLFNIPRVFLFIYIIPTVDDSFTGSDRSHDGQRLDPFPYRHIRFIHQLTVNKPINTLPCLIVSNLMEEMLGRADFNIIKRIVTMIVLWRKSPIIKIALILGNHVFFQECIQYMVNRSGHKHILFLDGQRTFPAGYLICDS